MLIQDPLRDGDATESSIVLYIFQYQSDKVLLQGRQFMTFTRLVVFFHFISLDMRCMHGSTVILYPFIWFAQIFFFRCRLLKRLAIIMAIYTLHCNCTKLLNCSVRLIPRFLFGLYDSLHYQLKCFLDTLCLFRKKFCDLKSIKYEFCLLKKTNNLQLKRQARFLVVVTTKSI